MQVHYKDIGHLLTNYSAVNSIASLRFCIAIATLVHTSPTNYIFPEKKKPNYMTDRYDSGVWSLKID
uniref:Uncharacterized protein n=1 Tax=Trichobilharzia regenti TaxID=157069 RepID=A0AA85K8Q0_TRIRE|nr:unnamed protein product [Trichobilharzia regenti]